MNRKRPHIRLLPFLGLAVLAPAAAASSSSGLAPETPHRPTDSPTAPASDDFGELLVVVREGELGSPVTAVFLGLEGPAERTGVTDADGSFRFERLPAGTYTIRADHLAYGTVEIEVEVIGDGTTRADIHLHRAPIALDPLDVEVERPRPTWGPLEQVYERVEWQQRLGLGSFVTREDIENRVAMRVTDLFRGMAGVRVTGGGVTMGRNRAFGCGKAVQYVDGMKIEGRLDEFVTPMEVEVIEVYRGASQVPAYFGGADAMCAVVAFWTRRGF